MRPWGLIVFGMVVLVAAAPAFGDIPESEPNDSPLDADPFGIGDFLYGQASSVYDEDWFTFLGQPGMQVRIRLYHSGSFLGMSNFGLWLWGPSVNLLAFADSPPIGTTDFEQIEYTLTASGNHYVSTDLTLWSSIAHAWSIETYWLNPPTPTPTITPTPTVTPTPWQPLTGVDVGWMVYR